MRGNNMLYYQITRLNNSITNVDVFNKNIIRVEEGEYFSHLLVSHTNKRQAGLNWDGAQNSFLGK